MLLQSVEGGISYSKYICFYICCQLQGFSFFCFFFFHVNSLRFCWIIGTKIWMSHTLILGTNIAAHCMTSTSTSVSILNSKASYGFILGPVIILTCYGFQFWSLSLWLKKQQFFLLYHFGFKFTHLFHAFKSTLSDEWLFFHGVSEGLSVHKQNMKGNCRGFHPRGPVAVRTCSQGSSPSSFDSAICLAWLSLFIWLTTAISTVVVPFIYSSDSKPIL